MEKGTMINFKTAKRKVNLVQIKQPKQCCHQHNKVKYIYSPVE